MGFLSFIIATLVSFTSADCGPEHAGEITVNKGVSVVKTLAEAEAQYKELYSSGRRITNRVYWDASAQSYVLQQKNKTLKISARFIESLSRQVEAALQRGYADFLFYTDMGHAHLYMPDSGDIRPSHLESHLGREELTFLYHTAELFMLKHNFKGALTSDPWLQWRYYSRNFVAKNDTSDALTVLFSNDELYNTVRDLEDHSSVSTVYMSASRNGCFPFRQNGETFYFDFTFN